MTMVLAGVDEAASTPFSSSMLLEPKSRQVLLAALQENALDGLELLRKAKNHLERLAFVGFTHAMQEAQCQYLHMQGKAQPAHCL